MPPRPSGSPKRRRTCPCAGRLSWPLASAKAILGRRFLSSSGGPRPRHRRPSSGFGLCLFAGGGEAGQQLAKVGGIGGQLFGALAFALQVGIAARHQLLLLGDQPANLATRGLEPPDIIGQCCLRAEISVLSASSRASSTSSSWASSCNSGTTVPKSIAPRRAASTSSGSPPGPVAGSVPAAAGQPAIRTELPGALPGWPSAAPDLPPVSAAPPRWPGWPLPVPGSGPRSRSAGWRSRPARAWRQPPRRQYGPARPSTLELLFDGFQLLRIGGCILGSGSGASRRQTANAAGRRLEAVTFTLGKLGIAIVQNMAAQLRLRPGDRDDSP